MKFSPLEPGTGSPYVFGRQAPETRQVRKIGQRRDAAEEYRKVLNNSNHTASELTNRPPPPPQHQQSRPLSGQSSPTFGPPRPMQNQYGVHSGANNHINQSDPNSHNVQLLRSPSPQSRDLRKRSSTGALPKPKEQKLRDSSGIGIADLIRPDSSKPQPTYTLHMRQQPLAARACGFGERDRRVVDPPPILELRITPPPPSSNPVPAAMSASDEMARRLRYPYYVVHCSLWDASRDVDSGAMEGDGTAGGGERRNQQRRLMGTLVASPFVGKDERGVEGCFFCFPDLSCRTTGQYRLKFVLMVLDPNTMRLGTRVPFSASVTSGVVTVFAAKDFPGMQASTALTRRLKEQGCLISVKKGIEKIGERGGESEDEGAGNKRANDAEAQRPFLAGESGEDVMLKMKVAEEDEPKPRKWTSWVRIMAEVMMAGAIVVLLLRGWGRGDGHGEKPSPVPTWPKKTVTFNPNERYLHDGMFANETAALETLHNWIELSADGRGYIKIQDAEKYGLGKAYDLNVNVTHTEPAYMLSVFHQLHCLSYLAVAFQTAFTDKTPSSEVAFHSVHCFDYIRQGILCNADTSLEGDTGHPGWGGVHQCTDIDKLREWANQRDVYKYRGNMPSDAVL
ncbi:hypothetical protein V492_07717 [Pseudogymnoascus sp. VKM F-4246]|nr:hypothetical protein V492_07717 [Pseudogymnoascus sp. VKM F-4246]